MAKKDPSEELRQRGLSKDKPTLKIQNLYFYNLGATTLQCLQDNGIINVTLGTCGNKKPDQIVVEPDTKKILVYVEYKQQKEFNTEAKKTLAFNEQIFVVRQIGCPLYIITDGVETEWLNPFQSIPGKNEKDKKNGKRVTILDEIGNQITRSFKPEEIKTMPNRVNEFKKLYNLIYAIKNTISSTENQLKPVAELDPTNLSRAVWQSIYAATGARPEKCLYTFVEIFVYKYLSDLGIISGIYSFSYLLNMYALSGTKPIDVLKYYMDTVREYMKKLFPAGADGTTIINGSVFHISADGSGNLVTNNGDENTFKDIIEAFDAYEAEYGKFIDIDKDFKTKLFESFLKNDNDVRKKSGQFFTPLKVVQPIVEMAEIYPGMTICDPACGVGKFLLEAIADKIDAYYSFDEQDRLVSSISLSGFEKEDASGKDNRVIILAKANFLIYFAKFLAQYPDESHCRAIAETFNSIFTLKKGAGGTLEHLKEGKYDLILTNPPYLVNGSGKLKANMSNSSEYTWNGLGLESLFMEWIVKSLKASGTAYVVIPDGLLSNMQNSTLKKKIKEFCYIRGLISLPLNSFFATNKKTYIIILQKKVPSLKDGATPAQKNDVFMYLCSSIGETLDVYRFPDPEHNDLEKAVRLYKIYRAGGFNDSLFSADDRNDKRLKLLPVEEFADDETWIIEKHWTDEEKEELGIKEKTNTADIDEFDDMVSDLKDSISTMIGDLNIMKASLEKSCDTDDEMEDVPLLDLFTLKNGLSDYTQQYCKKHAGKYKVYSGNTEEVFAYIDSYDYDGSYLTWAKDGSAGYIMRHENEKFSITGHRSILIPKDGRNDIYLPYIKYILEPIFRSLKKGRLGENGKNEYTTLNPQMIRQANVKIPMPKKNGAYDYKKQEEIAKKQERIDELKAELQDKVDEILSTSVTFK